MFDFWALLLALLALAFAGGASAKKGVFVVNTPGTLTISRMDPIVNPGALAGHVHRVVGASNFNAGLNTPDEQLAAECTTIQITDDKSNYWVPSLYWINKNGTYTLMPHATKIYYTFHFNGKEKTHPFPPGLRMVSGLAMRRDPASIAVPAIDINYTPYAQDPPYNHQYLANGTSYGATPPKGKYIHMNIAFPYCGRADQQLDSDDHFSHMSWGINQRGEWDRSNNDGMCPESHPVLYPRIFLENFYYLDDRMKAEWNPKGSNFILSNGDVTGLTFHADFVSGWVPETLGAAVDGPNACDVGHNVENCKAFKPSLNKTANEHECRYQGQIPAEDVGFAGPLENLPGCNPRWDWDGPTEKPMDCPWYKEPGWTSPNLMYHADHGAVHNNFPVVLPGVHTSNLSTLGVPTAGRSNMGPLSTPRYVEWALDAAALNRTQHNVMVGTQEEVDAAAAGPVGDAAQCQTFGRKNIGKGWEGRYPNPEHVQKVDTTPTLGRVFKQTYLCREPIYLPCNPPDNSTLNSTVDGTSPSMNSTALGPNMTASDNVTAPLNVSAADPAANPATAPNGTAGGSVNATVNGTTNGVGVNTNATAPLPSMASAPLSSGSAAASSGMAAASGASGPPTPEGSLNVLAVNEEAVPTNNATMPAATPASATSGGAIAAGASGHRRCKRKMRRPH